MPVSVFRQQPGGGAPPPAADIAEFIDALVTTHRWKCDESSPDPLLDSGSGTTRDLAIVGVLGYEAGGPDDSTESVDGNGSSDFARNAAGGMDVAATGTVFFFIKQISTGVTIISNNNTANETSQIQFGDSPVGSGVSNRVGVVQMTSGGFTNRRSWNGDTDISAFSGDTLWHLFGFTADGIGTMKIYLDGVEETVATQTVGTPPAITSWLSSHTDGNMRVVAMNGRFSGGSGNQTGEISEVCVLNGVIMDEADFAELFALVTN